MVAGIPGRALEGVDLALGDDGEILFRGASNTSLYSSAYCSTVGLRLAAHPSICLVSRDRGTAIVEGVTRGAPQAVQVADRWHLLKNLGEALERLLVRQRTEWHTDPPRGDAGGASR